nr:DUF4476 domain-containing protein [uncultured Flavobacterium sp.]
MKKITLLCIVTLLTAFAGFAQRYQTGNLTIFSEDGAQFYLILNGQRYNDKPQTNVRVEMLPNPYYDCKIVFANNRIQTLSKNIQIADMDDIMQDVTYRIKKDKKGRRTLRFYSQAPAAQNMVRPKNCAVYHYGEPNDMYIGPDNTVYHQETTTTTYNDGFGMNVNMGGVGMSVSVPGGMGTTTTTTTTTTTGGYPVNNSGNYNNAGNYNNGNGGNYNNNNGGYNNGNGGYNNGNNGNYNNNGGYNNGNNNNGGYNNNNGNYNNGNNNNTGGCRNAMSSTDFNDALETIRNNKFDDTRMSSAKEIIATNCLSTSQILTVVKLLSYEDNKLELAKYAYNYCVERNNYFKVVNAFTYESSKTELNEYIKSQR